MATRKKARKSPKARKPAKRRAAKRVRKTPKLSAAAIRKGKDLKRTIWNALYAGKVVHVVAGPARGLTRRLAPKKRRARK